MRARISFVRLVSNLVLLLLFCATFSVHTESAVHAAGLWYVAQSGDDANDCLSPVTACASINAALAKIVPGDTILVDSGVYTSSDFIFVDIRKAVTLSGGWNPAFTSQTGYTTVEGDHSNILIDVNSEYQPVIIERFIVQKGSRGIFSFQSILTIDHCIIQDNHGVGFDGGGISSLNSSALYVLDSVIQRNLGTTGGIINIAPVFPRSSIVVVRNSAIIDNTGSVVGGFESPNGPPYPYIENSTISGNYGKMVAGGVSGLFELYNSTITGNSSTSGGGGIACNTCTIRNSIVAGNSSPDFPNCKGDITSAGHNLFGDLTGCTYTLQPGDLSVSDPALGPLEGAFPIHYLLPASPAIDAGDPSGCIDHAGAPLSADQRGKLRFGRCDIGAFELQPIEYSTFQVDNEQIHLNEILTFTAQLRTGGTETILGVSLSNVLPAGITYLPNSLQASSGTALYNAGQVTWNGDLDSTASVTLTYQATASDSKEVENTILITHGTESVSRSVRVEIAPWTTFFPITYKPCPNNYVDYFNDPNSGWYTENTKDLIVQYQPLEYQVLIQAPQYFVASRAPTDPVPEDFQVSVDVRNVTGKYAGYGLLFGAQADWSSFYTLQIFPNQLWSVWKWDGANWLYLGSNAFRNTHPDGKPDTLTVRHELGQIYFNINGEDLGSLPDYGLSGPSYVGVMAESYSAVPIDVRFSNFFVPEFSCATPPPFIASTSPGALFESRVRQPLP